MPEKRPHPLGLLAGFAFIAIVVAGFAIGGESPSVDDSAQKVVDFYNDNHDAQVVAILMLGVATVFGAIFIAHFATLLRGAGAGPAWTALAAVGGVVLLGGLLVAAAVHFAVTDAADNKYAAETVRGLAALDNNTWIPMGAGMGMFMIGSWRGAARHGARARAGWPWSRSSSASCSSRLSGSSRSSRAACGSRRRASSSTASAVQRHGERRRRPRHRRSRLRQRLELVAVRPRRPHRCRRPVGGGNRVCAGPRAGAARRARARGGRSGAPVLGLALNALVLAGEGRERRLRRGGPPRAVRWARSPASSWASWCCGRPTATSCGSAWASRCCWPSPRSCSPGSPCAARRTRSAPAVGALTGALTTATSVNGPPLLAVAAGARRRRRRSCATRSRRRCFGLNLLGAVAIAAGGGHAAGPVARSRRHCCCRRSWPGTRSATAPSRACTRTPSAPPGSRSRRRPASATLASGST